MEVGQPRASHPLAVLAVVCIAATGAGALPVTTGPEVFVGDATYGWLNTWPDVIALTCIAALPMVHDLNGTIRIVATRLPHALSLDWAFEHLNGTDRPCIVGRPCLVESAFGWVQSCINTGNGVFGRIVFEPRADGSWDFRSVFCDLVLECEYVVAVVRPL